MNNSICLVTGATRGLGYAAALSLARRGAHIVAVGRTVGGLEDLDDAIKKAGGEATLVPLDLNDDPGLERLGAALYERWGRLDLVVHAAAEAAPMAPAEHIAAAELDKVIAANFRAVQRLIRVVDPLLKRAKTPQAVFLVDPDAEGARFNGAYGAVKAAARALVMSWAKEQARHGPRIWLAAPPPMPTAIRARSRPGEDPMTLSACADVAARLVDRIASADVEPGETVAL
ncbi:SDR family NAD(P)-dependent oxidoreductase [Pikeienuella sp. HZG-20]|uniref:SDR family NAD(P)-dependent oxidoreductase n=1 Tax=Paludibacillus litoralis TaxID=3133267 RepID=UPI0030EF6EA1